MFFNVIFFAQQEITNEQFEKLLTVQQNCFAQLTELKR